MLWLSNCGVRQLDGLRLLPSLAELYVSYNSVSDLAALMDAPALRVLDLEGNCVADPRQLDFLSSCACLRSVTLARNPLAGAHDYRLRVIAAAPSSTAFVDDCVVDEGERTAAAALSADSASPRETARCCGDSAARGGQGLTNAVSAGRRRAANRAGKRKGGQRVHVRHAQAAVCV